MTSCKALSESLRIMEYQRGIFKASGDACPSPLFLTISARPAQISSPRYVYKVWYKQKGQRLHDCSHRYGYKGFYDKRHKPVVLTRKVVEGIQLQGGTILVSRQSPTYP